MEPAQKPAEAADSGTFARWKRLIEVLQQIGAVLGILATGLGYAQKNPWVLGCGLGVALVGIGSLLLVRFRARRRRSRQPIGAAPPSPKAYLRGLLPFERGDSLLGRETDIRKLVAIVTSSDFRFGYVSGEAGTGKTSLLRAGLLTQAQNAGFAPLYIPKPGVDPSATIERALRRELGEQLTLPENVTLRELLAAAQTATGSHPLLLICDQFEEFFIANRTQKERATFLHALGECCAASELNARFLLGLRKEFVDDLRELEPEITQPLDSRYSHRLRNWDADQALAVLREAARHDSVPFAEALEAAIVHDLQRAGQVRPVELQIVATRLADRQIYDLAQYREAKGATGILKSYITDVIEPNGDQTPELERQVGRHLLRSLCDEKDDVKRPTGLQYADISQRIRASLTTHSQADLVADAEQYDRTLRRVMERCISAYLLLAEDEQAFNLVHDYLVSPIREATAAIEPIQEQADRLLEQYIDAQRGNPRATIDWRHCRLIQRYASAERKTRVEAAALFRNTRRRQIRFACIACILIGVLWLLALPPRVGFFAQELIAVRSNIGWYASWEKHYLVVVDTEAASTAVWWLDEPWDKRVIIPIRFVRVVISPHGTFVAGITPDDRIYLWSSKHHFHGKIAFPFRAYSGILRLGFSDDERWIYLLTRPGHFYAWSPTQEVPVLSSASVQPPPTGTASPEVVISPHGKFAAIITRLSLTVLRMDLPNIRVTATIPPAFLNPIRQCAASTFSHDDTSLAFSALARASTW